MKKIMLVAVALMLGMGCAYAQGDDPAERQKQQEALLKQQQKEQEALLQQQMKEQEELQKKQEREEQKAIEEQRKAEEKAYAQQQKDEARKAKEEQKKAEKKQKRAERRAAIGRGMSFGIDPFTGYVNSNLLSEPASLYNSVGYELGAVVTVNYPLSKKWDLTVGAGYRMASYSYLNTVKAMDGKMDTILTNSPYRNMSTLGTHTILVPIMLSHFDKDKKHTDVYFGIRPGYTFKNSFGFTQLGKDNKWSEPKHQKENIDFLNAFRLDVVLGSTYRHFLIFNPGISLFFNLMPTYTPDGAGIHEFGINIAL